MKIKSALNEIDPEVLRILIERIAEEYPVVRLFIKRFIYHFLMEVKKIDLRNIPQ